MGLWCCGVLAGIGLVKTGVLIDGFGALAVGLSLLLPAVKRTRFSLLLIVISGLLIGNWQGTRTEMEVRSLTSYVGQKVSLQGRVLEDPIINKRGELQFYITDLNVEKEEVAGIIRITTKEYREVKREDVLLLTGKLGEGYGNYQAKMNFAKIISLHRNPQLILDARDSLADGVRWAVIEPEASLGLGFLLGQRSALPDDLDEDMRRVGLTHIVVASGYNLTILVRFARRSLAGISKFQALAAGMGLMICFVGVTGFTPSMSRAAFVTTLSLLAWYYGRKIHPVIILLFVAAVTGLINPLYVWSDLGWYLSFLAFAGVLMLAPLICACTYKDKKPSALMQVCIETTAAQAMTVPLILLTFGTFSTLALIANVIVVPLIPLTMVVTLVAGIVGIIAPAVAPVVGIPAIVLLSYITGVTAWLASVPWAMSEIKIGSTMMLAAYGLLLMIGMLLWRRTRYQFRDGNIAV